MKPDEVCSTIRYLERCIGRGQSKKWACSIKAVQGSKEPTPIGKWISRTGHARAHRLGDLKERTVWVLWPAENAFFRGQITDLDAAKGLHHVKYSDGVLMQDRGVTPQTVETPVSHALGLSVVGVPSACRSLRAAHD